MAYPVKDGIKGFMIAGGMIYDGNTVVWKKEVNFLDLADENGSWIKFPDLPFELTHGHMSYLGK